MPSSPRFTQSFGIAAIDLQYFAARLVLFFAAVPVLGLHVLVWAAARFLSAAWAMVAAVVLNAAWAAGGLAFQIGRAGPTSMAPDQAIVAALWFFITGLAASALLIGWVRFTVRRRLRAASGMPRG